MNILFLTLVGFESVKERGIYTDLLREFIKRGHCVYAISPVEKREGVNTHIVHEDKAKILRLRIMGNQKTGMVKKGLSTVLLAPTMKRAVKKYFSDVKFDLVVYSTPPITYAGAIEYIKRRDGARTYLLLKDIIPDGAVSLGVLKTTGLKGIIYKYFRSQEKRLYRVSDRIGCMSRANVKYILSHNFEVYQRNNKNLKKTGKFIIEVCPNSIEPIDLSVTDEGRRILRDKYNIPQDRLVFVYGGNLGRPQGIPFMLKCIHSQRNNDNVFFLIVGNGTEYLRIESYIKKYNPSNMALYNSLPKNDYDKLVAACDVGMIFLDHRIDVPNIPSRLLSYMQAKLPVLAVTDPCTDLKEIITGVNSYGNQTHDAFGWWCESNNVEKMISILNEIEVSNLKDRGNKAYDYMIEHYLVSDACEMVLKSMV